MLLVATGLYVHIQLQKKKLLRLKLTAQKSLNMYYIVCTRIDDFVLMSFKC